jgi:membrane fusion protein (multidrug efflux system)
MLDGSPRVVKVKVAQSTRRSLGIVAGIAVGFLLLVWLTYDLFVGQYFVSTDDAYIAADSAMISPKIGGYVSTVLVNDNQAVSAGQLLATIDDRDYQSAFAGAKADVQAARAAILSDQAQLSLQQAKIAAAQATVEADQARENFAALDKRRYAQASAAGASTAQSAAQADTELATAQATLDADKAGLLGAQREVDVLNAQLAQANASLAQARAKATQAALDLSHTEIVAPFNGVVGDKTVAAGDFLQPGTEIMAIVPLRQVYVLANYKETQITNIWPGQKVTISVDGFPGLHVTGFVDSLSPSSGQEFALLPPDNATGNFTKIVQRLPVKIDIDMTPDLVGKLRPGMSVEPDIDTRQRPQSQ